MTNLPPPSSCVPLLLPCHHRAVFTSLHTPHNQVICCGACHMLACSVWHAMCANTPTITGSTCNRVQLSTTANNKLPIGPRNMHRQALVL